MIRRVGRCDYLRLSPAFLCKSWSPCIGNPYLNGPQTGRAKRVTTLLDTFADRGWHGTYPL